MMKKHKSIFILFLTAVLCAGFYLLIAQNIGAEDTGKLFELGKNEQVTSVKLKNEYGEFAFDKENDEWVVSAGETYRTNEKKMKLFIDALHDFAYSRQLEDDNGEYGLSAPAVELAFATNENKTYEFAVGNMTASQNDVYVRDESTEKIYIIPLQSVVQFTGSLAAYRDNEVFSVDIGQIAEVEYYKNKELQVSLLTEDQDTWYMQHPYRQLARKIEMQEFMTMLKSWTVAGYPTLEEADYEAVGLENPEDILVVTDRNGKTQEIAFGKSDGTITYVRIGDRQEVVGLYTADVDLSRLDGNTMVYVAPMKAPISEVASITIEGADKYTFELQEDAEIVTCNGRLVGYAQFEKVFYKYVSLIAGGGEKEPVKPQGKPLLTLTSEYRQGQKTTLELYERDDATYYMGINGEVQFYMEKEKLADLIQRVQECLN